MFLINFYYFVIYSIILLYINMNMLYPTLTLVALLVLVQGTQDVPIPKGQYGFSVGDPFGTLQIMFFLDFQCPDSKDAYNTWKTVQRSVSLYQNHIKLTYQFNPLPYHFYAFKVHQAFFYVLEKAGVTSAEDYIDYVFANQDEYTEEKYLNKNGAQFQQSFAQEIATKFRVDQSGLLDALQTGSAQFQKAKSHWKYTVGVYGVAGAPLFYGNGVRIQGSESFSYKDWINFITSYKAQHGETLKTNNLQIESI